MSRKNIRRRTASRAPARSRRVKAQGQRKRAVRRPLGRGVLNAHPVREWQVSASTAARQGLVTVQLPALRDLLAGWRTASAALAVVCVAVLAYLLHDIRFYVYEVELSGASRVPALEIYEATGVDTDHILWIDPQAVRRNVEAVSGVEQAWVSVSWPARVQVAVRERQPALLWRQAGQEIWLDRNGTAFDVRGEVPGLLPIEVDPPAQPFLVPEEGPAVPLAVVEGALQLKALRPNIELLHYDPVHGLSYQDGRGWRGYFGGGIDMDVKLLLYETLVDDLLEREIQPQVVSVENVDAPFYRK